MKRRLFLGLCSLLLLTLSGCGGDKIKGDLRMLSFHVETSPSMPPGMREEAAMPDSGQVVRFNPKSLLTSNDTVGVELREVPSTKELVFRFVFTQKGAQELYQESSISVGRLMVTKINGRPFSAARITGPIDNGEWWTPVPKNITKEQALELQQKTQETLSKVQESLKKQRDRTKPLGSRD